MSDTVEALAFPLRKVDRAVADGRVAPQRMRYSLFVTRRKGRFVSAVLTPALAGAEVGVNIGG